MKYSIYLPTLAEAGPIVFKPGNKIETGKVTLSLNVKENLVLKEEKFYTKEARQRCMLYEELLGEKLCSLPR